MKESYQVHGPSNQFLSTYVKEIFFMILACCKFDWECTGVVQLSDFTALYINNVPTQPGESVSGPVDQQSGSVYKLILKTSGEA